MDEKRYKLMLLFNTAAVGIGADGLLPQEEVDEIWNSNLNEVGEKLRKESDGELNGDMTIGELVDRLLQEMPL